ncbi:hypothetical protein L1049_000665 [Liquidambar formosana]|uniref:Uncharacterized protein n=1 Tax=Liquidambar formosana TaxID=63359 RepID=A0AAP0N9E7_LIQFO
MATSPEDEGGERIEMSKRRRVERGSEWTMPTSFRLETSNTQSPRARGGGDHQISPTNMIKSSPHISGEENRAQTKAKISNQFRDETFEPQTKQFETVMGKSEKRLPQISTKFIGLKNPILKHIDETLIPPGKYSDQIVALNQKVGGLFYPNYPERRQFPELAKFRHYFTHRELLVADALWHNVKNNLDVDFRQNVVSIVRHMRTLRLTIAQLENQLKNGERLQEIGESSSQKLLDCPLSYPQPLQPKEQTQTRYKRITYTIIMEVPIHREWEINPLPEQQLISAKAMAIDWACKIARHELPDQYYPIPGYVPCLPTLWINNPQTDNYQKRFLFQVGFIRQISVQKDLSEIEFLPDQIYNQLQVTKDFIPFHIYVWSIAPDSSNGHPIPGFHLIRVTDEEVENPEVIASAEVKPINIGHEDLARVRSQAILQIAEKLLDKTEKWYTLNHSEQCVIQFSDPYGGSIEKVEKKAPAHVVRMKGTPLDGICVGLFNKTAAARAQVILTRLNIDKHQEKLPQKNPK